MGDHVPQQRQYTSGQAKNPVSKVLGLGISVLFLLFAIIITSLNCINNYQINAEVLSNFVESKPLGSDPFTGDLMRNFGLGNVKVYESMSLAFSLLGLVGITLWTSRLRTSGDLVRELRSATNEDRQIKQRILTEYLFVTFAFTLLIMPILAFEIGMLAVQAVKTSLVDSDALTFQQSGVILQKTLYDYDSVSAHLTSNGNTLAGFVLKLLLGMFLSATIAGPVLLEAAWHSLSQKLDALLVQPTPIQERAEPETSNRTLPLRIGQPMPLGTAIQNSNNVKTIRRGIRK